MIAQVAEYVLTALLVLSLALLGLVLQALASAPALCMTCGRVVEGCPWWRVAQCRACEEWSR